MKKTIKRHAVSAALTFATGFAIALLSQIDQITMQSFQNGAWVGIVFAAGRAGFKVSLELFVSWRASKK